LLQRVGLQPSSEAHLLKAEAAAERISVMIQFTKEYESIGIKAPVWHSVLTMIQSGATEALMGPINLVNDVPEGVEVFADPLMAKVFHNLIDNAVKHGVRLTTIRFHVEERDGALSVICEDDGVGISPEDKERLFERGFGKNHGLGLFLSREILAITGITITETGKEGQGARFEMLVPPGAWRSGGRHSRLPAQGRSL